MGEFCKMCISQTPFASVIATVMCLVATVIYCYTLYEGASINIGMLDPFYKVNPRWIRKLHSILIGIFVGMLFLGIMIFSLGIASTGYPTNKYFVARRVSCIVLLLITYLLFLGWSLNLCFMVMVTFVYMIFSGLCSTTVDITTYMQLKLWIPQNSTFDKALKDCEIQKFCAERVGRAEFMLILATISTFGVIVSLVHYLMCLAANYSNIRRHEKLQ